jgi:hypothetical protein
VAVLFLIYAPAKFLETSPEIRTTHQVVLNPSCFFVIYSLPATIVKFNFARHITFLYLFAFG